MSDDSSQEPPVDDEGTTNSNYRWKWLATSLAALIGLSLPLIVILAATGMIELGHIPQEWYGPYIVGWMMVMVYALGEDTLAAVQKARGK